MSISTFKFQDSISYLKSPSPLLFYPMLSALNFSLSLKCVPTDAIFWVWKSPFSVLIRAKWFQLLFCIVRCKIVSHCFCCAEVYSFFFFVTLFRVFIMSRYTLPQALHQSISMIVFLLSLSLDLLPYID